MKLKLKLKPWHRHGEKTNYTILSVDVTRRDVDGRYEAVAPRFNAMFDGIVTFVGTGTLPVSSNCGRKTARQIARKRFGSLTHLYRIAKADLFSQLRALQELANELGVEIHAGMMAENHWERLTSAQLASLNVERVFCGTIIAPQNA